MSVALSGVEAVNVAESPERAARALPAEYAEEADGRLYSRAGFREICAYHYRSA
ncbi:hypothetical protein [Actinoplanes sp. L3-i22]|uniref:hypothetical protein n=1 Tax=Actinoplanes sp. L3-i22 TaxID=2836373 RepID=UPI001C76610E|nr:hypothetical protein [Actinoplanes sp. L3-i22]BCY10136.1 hypothetical protein L3i22_052240 [Actinoplanes sp. L3-i22]